MKKRVRRSQSNNNQLFDLESPLAIEMRRIMIRLGRSLDFDRKRCLMITSAELGEGKSLFSLHFSMVLAYHLKQRILLIDGDVRRPVQHHVFEVPRSPGLAEHLASLNGNEAVKPRSTQIPNLGFLPAGAAGQHPSRLFSGGRFRAAIGGLQDSYDIIIVDAPPVVPVSDPLHYVEAVDGVLFLVMAGRTHRNVVRRGVEILRGTGAKILGVVANNLSEVLPYYYDRKYYGYDKGKKRQRSR